MYPKKPKDMPLSKWNELYKPKWLVTNYNDNGGSMSYYRESTRKKAVSSKNYLLKKWHKDGRC